MAEDSSLKCDRQANLADRGRVACHAGDTEGARDAFQQALADHPDWWWLRVELLRIEFAARRRRACGRHESIECVFSPHYEGNPYQAILYGMLPGETVATRALAANDIHRLPELAADRPSGSTIFHQHWVREIYRDVPWSREGRQAIDWYFGCVKAAKAFGAKVLWTVHNILDHDLAGDEKSLNIYTLESCASTADFILVHNQVAMDELSEVLRRDISRKSVLLEHPLYDSDLSRSPECPRQIRERLSRESGVPFIFLMFGMLRPYKGGTDLLRAFRDAKARGAIENSKLILAGRLYDSDARAMLESGEAWTKDVWLMDERVSAEELAWLCRNADVGVLPYRAILTSGSYYQATTFQLPVIVPEIGMFKEAVEDGKTAFTYHTLVGLRQKIEHVYGLDREELRSVGYRAYQACLGQTESAVGSKFQELLQDCMTGGGHEEA